MPKARKEDPFFTHLWDELTSAKILQEGLAAWKDAPAKLRSKFIAAARKATKAALGIPAKPAKVGRKVAKKRPVRAKPKAKPKTKRRLA